MLIGPAILLAASSCSTAEAGKEHMEAPASPDRGESIGVATQEPDGTIVLTLRSEGDDGSIGDGRFRYPPDDPQYEMIKAHVGTIPVGGAVPVKPFARK
jgi:hypothetical protein